MKQYCQRFWFLIHFAPRDNKRAQHSLRKGKVAIARSDWLGKCTRLF